MYRLIQSTRVIRALRTFRSTSNCRKYQFTCIPARSNCHIVTPQSGNVAQELRGIVNTVNSTWEDKLFRDMYNEIENKIKRFTENGSLATLAREGYSSCHVLSEHEVSSLLPQFKQVDVNIGQCVEKFLYKYPELSGFKLYSYQHTYEMCSRKYIAIGIKW